MVARMPVLEVVVVVGVLVLMMVVMASSFPSGAPLSACGHLMPIHEDAVVQESAPPYLIVMSSTNYTGGHPIVGKSSFISTE
jgi:hypothetical protein